MRPEAVTKNDQDWREALVRCVDAIRPLRGIRVPTAVQARSPWRAHGFGDANGANCLSLLKGLGRLPSHPRLPEAVNQKTVSPGARSSRGAGSKSVVL